MQTIYKVAALSLLVFIITAAIHHPAQAQNFRIVTVNTFAGALTGTALGGATIALQNKSDVDYYPLQFGVGMGTIFGLGVGFYDLSQATTGSGYYVDGIISSAGASGTIILLDTFYGAATGAIVGTAITLMTNSRIVKGVQYGAGAGAWAGFAFGLIDAFVLSVPGDYDQFYDDYASAGSRGNTGFFEVRSDDDRYRFGFLNPMVFNSPTYSLDNGFSSQPRFGVELTRINISL